MIRPRTGRRLTRSAMDSADAVSIVADGAIAGPIADGRMLPLVIIDTTERPELEELVRLHGHLQPGDVTYRWGQIDRSDDQVALALRFVRPIEAAVDLIFSIERQGILVDAALSGRGIYLQPGRPGDRVIHNPHRAKILIEVPDDRFRDRWEEIVVRRLAQVIRRDRRMPRADARQLAIEWLDRTRQLSQFRMS